MTTDQVAQNQARTATRQIDLPNFLRVVNNQDALADQLSAVLAELGIGSPLFVSGTSQSAAVCADLTTGTRAQVQDNTRAEVQRIADLATAGSHDAIVAVGGGRPLDVAKAACLLAGIPVIVVPTQLSTDGIASPISVIQESDGRVISERSQLPAAVVADLETVAAAPAAFARAGLGDLIGNRAALVDWRIAAEHSDERVDDFAALLSSSAHHLVESLGLRDLGAGRVTVDLARRLLEGLVLSGLAMEIAGSSRPCSGAEHLISHSLDVLEPGTGSHGAQVAFGTLVAVSLQGGDPGPIRSLLAEAGMQRTIDGFGLSVERLVEVIKYAPATRPGRYTVLDLANPSSRELKLLLGQILGR
ncbi:MAG: iron-containing alcohol dehydrogenase [Thermoleophilaceae bacterium]|nr:iron-containing alcohol dehydrogenase [Thermoleophilaceae bacterium]